MPLFSLRTALLPCLLLTNSPAPADFSSPAEHAIRAARTRFNAAIAAHDSAALDADWTDDIVVVSSRGQSTASRAEYRAMLLAQFRKTPSVVYRRVPDRIMVQTAWHTAAEQGHWSGEWSDSTGTVEVGGTYLAQWREEGGRWRLRAEFFVLTRCRAAAYCPGATARSPSGPSPS